MKPLLLYRELFIIVLQVLIPFFSKDHTGLKVEEKLCTHVIYTKSSSAPNTYLKHNSTPWRHQIHSVCTFKFVPSVLYSKYPDFLWRGHREGGRKGSIHWSCCSLTRWTRRNICLQYLFRTPYQLGDIYNHNTAQSNYQANKEQKHVL